MWQIIAQGDIIVAYSCVTRRSSCGTGIYTCGTRIYSSGIFFFTSEVPMRFPELKDFHFGSSDGSGAPIWEPWGCIFGVLEFQRHCGKHA